MTTRPTEKNCLSCRYQPRWINRWNDEPGREGVCGRSVGGAPLIRIINIGRSCRQDYDIYRDNYPYIFNCPMWDEKR